MIKELTYDIALRGIEEYILHLQKTVPQKIRLLPTPRGGKIPFKVLSLKEVLVYRALELSETSFELYKKRKYLSSIIILRSLFETVAVISWMNERVKKVVKSQSVGDIDNFLMRSLFGIKNRKSLYQAFNVLTAVDKVTKKNKDFRNWYEILSECSHPNYSGGIGQFGRLNKKKGILDLESKTEYSTFTLLMLLFILKLLDICYNELDELFPKFSVICDESLTK